MTDLIPRTAVLAILAELWQEGGGNPANWHNGALMRVRERVEAVVAACARVVGQFEIKVAAPGIAPVQ